jgi:hypothetical protein
MITETLTLTGSSTEDDTPGRARARTTVLALAYALVSFVVLAPTLATPVMADDFVNPFAQVDDGGASLGAGMSFGWDSVRDGGSFRVIGVLIGSFVSWATLWVSATFDVPVSSVWGGVKFLAAIGCASAVAWLWRRVARVTGAAPIGVFESTAALSGVLFATLQIHADWSNDPVSEYPLVGYGSVALGFVGLALAVRLVERPSWARVAVATIALVVAVNYYEMNLGAVVAAGIVLLVSVVRSWRAGRDRLVSAAAWLAVVLVPVVVYLVGRGTRSTVNSGYAGTTTRVDSRAVKTFGTAMVSSLPGAGWQRAIESVGGTLGLVTVAFAVVALLAWITLRHREHLRRRPVDAPGPLDRLMVAAIAVGLVAYWAIAVAIHSVTVKVQDESHGFGYVYISYMVGACVVALGLASGGRWLLRGRRGPTTWFALGAVALAFVFVQQTVNWRVVERLDVAYAPNRRLLDAFDDASDEPARCAALDAWSKGPWPDYYSQDVTGGLQKAYDAYFGEPFCAGFVRPP